MNNTQMCTISEVPALKPAPMAASCVCSKVARPTYQPLECSSCTSCLSVFDFLNNSEIRDHRQNRKRRAEVPQEADWRGGIAATRLEAGT
ncbi:hypothetical protein NDU88_006122 [Pleurodeles waltl]|uniref:Uncharacterized protein n=1 Tax=Pleurodeles waltl TaxID=8319 RepID=A0AAV7MCE1_PLEWA|nr:hypothetical protein NDU88_006122 [Pleurodeles waltl]